MTVSDALQDTLNETYHGTGLDNGLTPEEFVQQCKDAVDVWLRDEGTIAWKIFHGENIDPENSDE